jgi:DNA-directed RNA polymerase specialized sigma24 family protein
MVDFVDLDAAKWLAGTDFKEQPMDESFEASITAWIGDLKEGDDSAAQKLWDRYFERLTRVAGRKLGNASRRIADEEDVALSVFQSLCNGASAGRFDRLGNRDDLWKLLVAISGMKAVDQIRRQTSQKRGGGDVRGDSIVGTDASGGMVGFDGFMNAEPTPEFLMLMEEQQAGLFDALADDTQREIARLRFEGYANEEIAQQTGLALRSVERKLKIIRDTWSDILQRAQNDPTP